MICPDCNGKKQIAGIGCGPDGCRPLVMNCFMCDGTGEIDDAFIERRRKGREMRHDRVERGLSLNDEAKRLGISPYALSRIERGLLPKE